MTDAISIALSGINAATKRVNVAASNIANSQTPDYKPLEVTQTAQTTENAVPQGTFSSFTTRSVPFTPAFAPENPQANSEGFINAPNVDLVTETVNLTQAVTAYKANLAVMNTVDQMSNALLGRFDHTA